MQNAKYPGAEPIGIQTGQSLKLKYRMVVYAGGMDTELINKLSNF